MCPKPRTTHTHGLRDVYYSTWRVRIGSLTYNNYELLLHGLSYGITDSVQASVTVLSPKYQT